MSSSSTLLSIGGFRKLVAMVAGWIVELNSIVHTALRRGLVTHYFRHVLAYMRQHLVYLHNMNGILLRGVLSSSIPAVHSPGIHDLHRVIHLRCLPPNLISRRLWVGTHSPMSTYTAMHCLHRMICLNYDRSVTGAVHGWMEKWPCVCNSIYMCELLP